MSDSEGKFVRAVELMSMPDLRDLELPDLLRHGSAARKTAEETGGLELG